MPRRRPALCAVALAILLAGPAGAATPEVDASVRPGDDFYRYANGPWLKANRDKMIELASKNPVSTVVEQMLPKLLGPRTLAENPAVVAEVKRIGTAQQPEGVVACGSRWTCGASGRW